MLLQPIEQKAGPPGNGGASDAPDQMPQNRAAHARIKHHRHRPAGQPTGIEAGHRPFARLGANFTRGEQIGVIAGRAPGIIALHRAALARHHAGRKRMAAARIGARKAVAGGQRHHRAARARGRALAVGNTRYGAGGILCGHGGLAQGLRAGLVGIVDVEIGQNGGHIALEQQLLWGQARIGILWRGAGHGHRPVGQRIQRGIGKIGGADAGRAAAGKHPEADLLTFRALDILQPTQPHRDAFRGLGNIDDIGGIGPGGTGAGNQTVGSLSGGIKAQHGGTNISIGRGTARAGARGPMP